MATTQDYQYAAHVSWFNTKNRSARTAPAREAFENRFLEQADGDPLRAASLRAAFFADLTRKSVAARARRKAGAA